MNFKSFFLALFFSALPAKAHAELPSVTLEVSGADPAIGSIEASLFNSAEDFLIEVYLQQNGEVEPDGTFTAEFVGLEEGVYAISVVHDVNDNGILDFGFLGFGGESVGYSNNASSWLGRPSFEDASFSVTKGNQVVQISLD